MVSFGRRQQCGSKFDGNLAHFAAGINIQTDEGSNWDWSEYEWNAIGVQQFPAK